MATRSGIFILLGSGSSCDAGLPNSLQLLSEFKNHLKNDQEDETLHCYRNERPWWQVSKHLQNTINLIESLPDKADIEDFMHKFEPSFSLNSALSEEYTEYSEAYQSALRFIYWRLRTPTPDAIKYFKHLTNFLSFTNQNPLVIATLNWDFCVERSIGWENVSTGFDIQNSRIWSDDGAFNFRNDRRVWLIKLHGSLSWVDYSWRILDPSVPDEWITFNPITEATGYSFKKVAEVRLWKHEVNWDVARKKPGICLRSPIPWPRLIIFGSQKKKKYERSLAMFPYLRQHFTETLDKKKVLISIGFSWRDTWVSNLIRKAENKGLNVIDIKPSRKRKNPWVTPSGRIRIPCGARTALQNLESLIFPFVKQYIC